MEFFADWPLLSLAFSNKFVTITQNSAFFTDQKTGIMLKFWPSSTPTSPLPTCLPARTVKKLFLFTDN
jgi:hypothetical protein